MNLQQTPPMALKYINREMKERTGKLVLSDCGLRVIPQEVFEMDWLEELVITNGYKSEEEKVQQKSKVAKKVVKMKESIREPNFLSEIPEEIGRLVNLKKIRIGAQIKESPWQISDITPFSNLVNGTSPLSVSKIIYQAI